MTGQKPSVRTAGSTVASVRATATPDVSILPADVPAALSRTLSRLGR
ncbi:MULTISPECIES: hypothetical protein [Haloferacaceae]|uniref:Uncharacterized protein n=1 Tax=Halorubrum glutamatedens TaxID=2707018 RepID=A0ABD5QLI6_9EURY|nr:hypothetical protein [Halobellus captivus]